MSLLAFLILSRSVHFASVSLLFGAPLFWAYERGRTATDGAAGLPRSWRATCLLLRIAAPVAALSGLAWLIGILANMADGFASAFDPGALHAFFFETQFGPVAELRLVLLGLSVAGAILPCPAMLPTLGLLSMCLLGNQAWLGHAAEGGTGTYGAIMIATYIVHVLAGATWVGGLPPLLFGLAELKNRQDQSLRALAILSRYSSVALVAVMAIVASGIANAAFRVAGAFDKLLWTPYGTVLMVKIAAVGLMLLLACFNRFVAMPRLRRAATKGGAQTKVGASIGAELVLGLVVFGIAAVLGIMPPPQ